MRGYLMNEIIQLAIEFRNVIDKAKVEGSFIKDQRFREFPHGCCGIASELLARFLLDKGVNRKLIYVCGTYYDLDEPISHAWLETDDNIVIDITGDQFKYYPEPLKFEEKVYIGSYNDFYNLFEVDIEENCNNYYPLEDNFICNYLSRKELYEIILGYME